MSAPGRTFTALIGLLLLSILAPAAQAEGEAHWPMFRGPSASGVGDGATPKEWNVENGHNIRWKTPVDGLGHSSPVIWGDRIYLTTAVSNKGDDASLKVGLYGDIAPVDDEGAQRFEVWALDRKSGKVLWKQVAFTGEPAIKRHTKASHANSTPVTDGKHVVAFFGSEGLYTYDTEGKLLWKKSFGVLDSGFFMLRQAQWGFGSSPVIYDGKLLLQVDVQENSFLAALDVATGKELWRTAREEVPTWSSPAVVPYTGGETRGMQVVANGWKHIGGYDLTTGKELWKMEGLGDIPVPTPIFANDLIYITTAHGPGRPIYAVRTNAAGTIDTSNAAMAWHKEKAGNYMQTPLVHDGLAYFCYDNGVLSVYDAKTGERFHQTRLGGGRSGFTGSPVAANGMLYVTSENGDTYVLSLGKEPEMLATNELGETFMSSPAVADGVLFFRGRSQLVAVGEVPGSGANKKEAESAESSEKAGAER